jgi:nucleoid DNA-binding protein
MKNNQRGVVDDPNRKKCNEGIYKEVAYEHSISPKQVEELFTYVCKYTRKVIEGGTMDTVMLPHFGKFKIKTRQLQYLSDMNVHSSLVDKTTHRKIKTK